MEGRKAGFVHRLTFVGSKPIVWTDNKKLRRQAAAQWGIGESRSRVLVCSAGTAPPLITARQEYPGPARDLGAGGGWAFRRRKGVGMSHIWPLPRAYP